MDDDKEVETGEKKHHSTMFWIIVLLIVVTLVLLMVVFWESYSKPILLGVYEFTKHLVEENKWYSNLTFILIQFGFAWLFLPGIIFFDTILSFLMKDFWRPFLIIFLGNTVGSQICFFAVRFVFREAIERKYGNLKIFRAIRHEIEDAPWTASIMLSALFIPNAVKNYSIPLTNITYLQYALPNTVFFGMYASLMVHTGQTVKNVKSLFGEENSYSKKSTADRFWLFTSWATLLLTIVLIVVAGCRLYSRIQSYKETEKDAKNTVLLELGRV